MNGRARSSGACAVGVALALALAPPVGAQTTTGSPEAVAREYVQAMRSADWSGVAALMHEDALRSMRELLRPMFEQPEAPGVRRGFLGVATVEEAAVLSDAQVFARSMRFGSRCRGWIP